MRERQRDDIASAIITAVCRGTSELVTVTEIVDTAGISRKTFYKYFASLGEAMAYTQQRVVREISRHADRGEGRAENGRERFLRALENVSVVAAEHPDLIRFVSYFDYTFRERGLDARESHDYELVNRELRRQMAETLVTGQDDGSVRTGIDRDMVITAAGNALMGLVQRLTMINRAGSGPAGASGPALVALELDVWRTYLTPDAPGSAPAGREGNSSGMPMT
ncbi:hypothetical protein CJD44_14930 [Streptomyces sp. alain-838]|nr:hypothetical protein CJD44_14930 [Streptomyces sp. alain-838]